MLALGTREGVFPRKCHSYDLPEEILREWALLRLFLCFFYMGDSRFETQTAFFILSVYYMEGTALDTGPWGSSHCF